MTTSLTRQNLGFDFESPVYRFGALQTTASNALCVPIIYGKIKAAGNKIWQSTGTTSFSALVAFGEGKVNAISNVKVNDYDISTLTGCSYSAYLGDGSQEIDSRVTGSTQSDKAALVGGLKHTAYIGLALKASTKVANNYCNVTADITGKEIKVYTDTSTSTVKYSNNPAWCIFDFLTCSSGCNMPVEKLNIQSFIDAAAYCDAKVGTETDPRFSLNLILDQRKSRQAWLNQMLINCRADLMYKSDQKLSLVIEQDTQSVQDFTPDNIISGSEFCWTTPKDKRTDILKVRYIYPTEQCARVFAVAEADSFLSNPPIVQEVQAFGVTNFNQASRLAWYYLNQNNNGNKFISFKTTQVALDRIVGDVITLTSTFLGYVKKKMRIVQMAQAQEGQIQIVCREYNGAESAVLTTNLAGTNNDLVYTSVAKSESANNITIKYTDPYANNQALNISVSGDDINVTLATNASGAITTTATQIITAIQASTPASALVTVASASGNNGSGIVTAMTKTNLAGGTVGLYSDTMASVEPEINLINLNDNLASPDDIQSFSSAQDSNTIKLEWQPIDNTEVAYEIREGTSWDEYNKATVKLVSNGSSCEVSINEEKTYHYWIAAKNKYGTYSKNPKLSIIIVNDIPETNIILNENILDADTSEGTLENCFASQGNIILNSSVNWANTDVWSNYEVYYSPNVYYTSDEPPVPYGIWGNACVKEGSYTTKVYDLTSNLTSTISISSSLYSRDNSSNIEVKWKYSTDNSDWTDWQTFAPGVKTFRYYQFKIVIKNNNKSFTALTNFTVNIDVPDKDLYFKDEVISNASTGVTVDFSSKNVTFTTAPSVVANISDGTNGYCVVSAKSTTQATIKAYDNSGTAITAKVDIRVKGY